MGDDIKLDWHYEAYKSLQRRYENVIYRLAELNREIGRLTALNNDLRAKLRELQETAEDRSPLEDVELARLGDAVIEAAEAWFPGPCSLEPSPPERELAAAVKALQKARQG